MISCYIFSSMAVLILISIKGFDPFSLFALNLLVPEVKSAGFRRVDPVYTQYEVGLAIVLKDQTISLS